MSDQEFIERLSEVSEEIGRLVNKMISDEINRLWWEEYRKLMPDY